VQSPTVLQVNPQTIPCVKPSTYLRRLQKCTTLSHAAHTGSSASPDRPARLQHMGSLHQRVLLVFVTNTTGKEKNVQSLSWRTESPAADQQPASPSRCIRFLQVMPVPAQEMICGAAPPSAACIQPVCDNKLSPAHPVWKRASQIVSPGSPVGEVLPRKKFPKSTHARRRPGERALSDKHKLCDRKFTFPRRRPRGNTHASTSYPVRFPRTLGKHSSDTLKGPSENPPLRAHWARNTEDGRSFEYRLE